MTRKITPEKKIPERDAENYSGETHTVCCLCLMSVLEPARQFYRYLETDQNECGLFETIEFCVHVKTY